MKKLLTPIFLIFYIICPNPAQGQTLFPSYFWQVDTLIIAPKVDFNYRFPETHRPKLQTLRIQKNKSILQAQIDYRINNEEKIIEFFTPFSLKDTLRIRYQRKPFAFKSRYSLFLEDTLSEAQAADSLLKARKAVKLKLVKFENPFSALSNTLQTSGSIMRGVQIGSNRDFTLNSGLNLSMSGKLTDNLEIIAALTDEATPIQPEGNTQTLQEVDKVFVSFKSPYIWGTVGDFNLEKKGTRFADVNRKLQGLTLQGAYKGQGASATIATTRGYFMHMSFLGREGLQGPYQLTGKNGERDIVVLAGTEKVWIDGQAMTRGENNDYVIEYGNGQIRFTNKRLISGQSRIEIDFEYFPAIQKYNRTVYGMGAKTTFSKKKLRLKLNFYRENDNTSQLLDQGDELSTEEKQILQQAGDEQTNAFLDGVTFRGDSAGNYIKLDTLYAGQLYTYYKYTGSKKGDYSLTFSDVGQGKGAYMRDRLGIYSWVGPQKGRFAPVRLIPLPSRLDLADMRLEWNPGSHFSLKSEFAASSLDKNTLSSMDDSNNNGSALHFQAGLANYPLKLAGKNLGRLSLQGQGRYVEETFRSADRFQKPDYGRYWNVLQQAQQDPRETAIQLNMDYRPIQQVKLLANGGRLEKSDFSSARYSGLAGYDQEEIKAELTYETINSSVASSGTDNKWQRWSALLERTVWKFRPAVYYKGEWRKNTIEQKLSGFRFEDLGLKLGLFNWKHVQGFAAYNRRLDAVYDFDLSGKLIPQAATTTAQVTLELMQFSNTSARLNIIHRSKDYTKSFDKMKIDTLKLNYVDASVQDTVWQDRTTNLAEMTFAHAAWKKALKLSLQYRISSEQVALKEKVYLDVGENRGNLRYDKDLDEYVPDPDGKFLLYILPSGKFEPVTNLQTALRIKLDPYHYWRKTSSPLKKFFSVLSSESYFRVDEETGEKDIASLYLLNLNKFQGEKTLRGVLQFNQDFYILRRNRKLSFRLRYRYRKSSSNQFLEAKENEDRKTRESGLRADWRIISSLSSRSELRLKQLSRFSASNALRNRDVLGVYGKQNFSYRLFRYWEVGLESEFASEENRLQTYPIKLWYGTLKGRLSYSIAGKGRASAEYQYQTVNATSNPLGYSIPYEMARGRKEGLSQNWGLRVEYTIAKNVVFNVFYSGRDEAGFESVIHSGQAEIRAFF